MLRFCLTRHSRSSYARLQRQGTPRCPTVCAAIYYPSTRLGYDSQSRKDLFSTKAAVQNASVDDLGKLENAIRQGDRIQDSMSSIRSTARHRALIITPGYKDHEAAKTPGIKWMPTTIQDALLIHSTLRARGYGAADIRILADGFEFNGASDPTRENIIHSLGWLVNSAKPGDHRFFYFSGYGAGRDSNERKGKEPGPLFVGTEQLLLTTSTSDNLSSQHITDQELVYDNEALVAQISSGSYWEDTPGPPFYIYGSDLNAQFARLPPGSNLTCVIDSCASGRVLSDADAGFRDTESTSMGDSILHGISDGARAVKHRFLRSGTQENPPEEERDMDDIGANMFAWTAFRQRRDGVNNSDVRSGLFTRVWTEALAKDTDKTPLKIEGLFNNVSKGMLELTQGGNSYPQYIQLWTSRGDKTINPELREKIQERVTISTTP